MQLKYIYEHDIERDINGVIKVAQNDEESIKQELGVNFSTKIFKSSAVNSVSIFTFFSSLILSSSFSK